MAHLEIILLTIVGLLKYLASNVRKRRQAHVCDYNMFSVTNY
jgi:hypothetical protein